MSNHHAPIARFNIGQDGRAVWTVYWPSFGRALLAPWLRTRYGRRVAA